jgi:HEAT repeat protein
MQPLPRLVLSAVLLFAPWSVAQTVEGHFYAEKSKYLVGEPIFVILKIVNTGKRPVWLSFKDNDTTCQPIKLEVPGAKSASENWGCGIAGDCGRGSAGILPGGVDLTRHLLNHDFLLDQPGKYHVRGTARIGVRDSDRYDSPEISEVEVSNTFEIALVEGKESELRAALAPLVGQLNSQDFKARAEAVAAITDMAPPFMDDVLIDLSKTTYAYAAIQGLRKANTVKTRQALADLADHGPDSSIRMEALRNLARTGDRSYLPVLVRVMKTAQDPDTKTVAAEAAGDLGGTQATPELLPFVAMAEARTRLAGTVGLGHTADRTAVPVLIRLLLDSDSSVRENAANGLFLLTHRSVLSGNAMAHMKDPQAGITAYQHWSHWWNVNGGTVAIHGMADCSSPEPLD